MVPKSICFVLIDRLELEVEDNFTVIELAEEETIVAPDTVELLYPYPVLYLILVI